MSRSAADLPEDPAELRRFAAALAAEVHSKTLLIEKLRMQLSILRRARFGRSSEKLDREIEQLELLLGDIEEGDAERQARTEASDGEASSVLPSKKPSVRTPLPDHLPLETVMHEAPCVCPTCGATKFGRIGADERMVLEYVPSHFKRVLHVRPKMSCRTCETVVQAPMPTLPIEKGRPGPALLAHVLVSKYCDHLRCIARPHLRAQRSGDGPLRHGGLGRSYGGAPGAPGRADRASRARRRSAPCGRYAGSCAGSRPWPNENRPTMDGGERRKPLWIDGAAGGLVPLLAQAQGRARPRLAQGLSRHVHADAYAGFAGLYEAVP